jgi:hypothetical protein
VKGADSTVPKSVQDSVDSSLMEKSRRHLKERYSTSVDPSQLDKLLHVNGEEPKRSRDDSDLSRVSVSVRKEISTKFGMDVDGLMKTIENMHRPIEDVNVVSPSKRQQPQETVAAMVTGTDTDKRPETPTTGEPPELKQKREKRKKRSTLSLDEVHAALRTMSPQSGRTALELNNIFVIQCALWFTGCHLDQRCLLFYIR